MATTSTPSTWMSSAGGRGLDAGDLRRVNRKHLSRFGPCGVAIELQGAAQAIATKAYQRPVRIAAGCLRRNRFMASRHQPALRTGPIPTEAFRPAVHIRASPASNAVQEHPQEISDLIRIASEGNVLAQRPIKPSPKGSCRDNAPQMVSRSTSVWRVSSAHNRGAAESRHFPANSPGKACPPASSTMRAAPGQRFHLLLFAWQPLLLQARNRRWARRERCTPRQNRRNRTIANPPAMTGLRFATARRAGFPLPSGIANGGQPRSLSNKPGPRIRRPLVCQQQAVRLDEGVIGRPMGTRAGQEIGPQPKGILQHGLSRSRVGCGAPPIPRARKPPACDGRDRQRWACGRPIPPPKPDQTPRKQQVGPLQRGHQMPPRHRRRSACGPM